MSVTNTTMVQPAGWTGNASALSGNVYTPDTYGFVTVPQVDVGDLVRLGFVVVSFAGKRNNFTATTDPAPSNDNTQDFASGSLWYNTGTGSTGARIWECVSSATGAAVWLLKSTLTANFRNLLHGGDFSVNPFQRNIAGLYSSAGISASITNAITYFPDRWFGYVNNASGAVQLSAVADTSVAGFSQSCKVQRASGNTQTTVVNFGQVLETADSVRTQGQPVTLSFWAKSGANYSGGSLTAQVISGTGTNQSAAAMIGSTWTGQSNVINASQALTSTMTRYQFTGTAPAGCTQLGVQLSFSPTGSAGADDSITFNGIQLEIGASAGPFEHRTAQTELAICERYAWVQGEPAAGVIIGAGGATQGANAQVFYMGTAVQLIKAPTVTVSAGSFKVAAGAAAAAATGMAAGSTHTPNAISITTTLTQSAGGAATLQGGGGSGYIIASADF